MNQMSSMPFKVKNIKKIFVFETYGPITFVFGLSE